ncbi:hypothetical protein CesoFtcFv8_006859 [Champsocephalus esox]|uniref:Uncharacterized protein n=1 Tax=Champsocephalus esox TaxID=159716 RepID=A0AAN8H3W8_9TELE|nr:hypothetical protein CesoFtcFv8_006859 [Champsocephalus esox]
MPSTFHPVKYTMEQRSSEQQDYTLEGPGSVPAPCRVRDRCLHAAGSGVGACTLQGPGSVPARCRVRGRCLHPAGSGVGACTLQGPGSVPAPCRVRGRCLQTQALAVVGGLIYS